MNAAQTALLGAMRDWCARPALCAIDPHMPLLEGEIEIAHTLERIGLVRVVKGTDGKPSLAPASGNLPLA